MYTLKNVGRLVARPVVAISNLRVSNLRVLAGDAEVTGRSLLRRTEARFAIVQAPQRLSQASPFAEPFTSSSHGCTVITTACFAEPAPSTASTPALHKAATRIEHGLLSLVQARAEYKPAWQGSQVSHPFGNCRQQSFVNVWRPTCLQRRKAWHRKVAALQCSSTGCPCWGACCQPVHTFDVWLAGSVQTAASKSNLLANSCTKRREQ